MSKTDVITQARLKELLHYDPDTGLLTWLVSRGRTKAGSVAGHLHAATGYIYIRIDGVVYRAHRLIFLYRLGCMPPEVDHDNQVKDDNRWKNLNPATRTENCKNKPLYCTNTSGHVGVSYDKASGKWMAYIMVSYKRIYLGLFTEKSDAIAARQAAEIKYGFHENHGSAKS